MKHIVYVSQAERPFTTEDLASLLEHSRTRNADDGVTGLLIYRYNSDYGRGNFIQVVEGPDDKIDGLWRRISDDTRHHTIIVVEEGPIEARMFSAWTMGFKNVAAEDLEGFEGFSDLGSDRYWHDVTPTTAASALELLKSFYDGG